MNLTQEDLAKMLGVTRRTIANWENGSTIPTAMCNLMERISQTEENQTEEDWRKNADILTRMMTMMEDDRKFYQAIIERSQTQIDRNQHEIHRLIDIIAGGVVLQSEDKKINVG